MTHANGNGNGSHPNLELLEPEDVGLSVSSAPAPVAEAETSTEDMAAWMGLASSPSAGEELLTSGSMSDSLDVEEGDPGEVRDQGRVDEAGKTKTPLWSNPLMKLGFVAGVAGGCMLVVGLVVTTVQNAGRQDLASVPTQQREEAPAEAEDPKDIALRQQDEEIGDLKTRNALGNQQIALEMQESGTNNGNSQVSAAELLALRNQLAQRRTEQGQSPQSRETSSPAPSTVAPSRVTPAPHPAPRPAPTASVPRPAAPSPARTSRPEPAVPPGAQLAILASYGSFGSGSVLPPNTIASPITPSLTTAASPVETAEAVPAFSNDAPEIVAAVPSFDEVTPKQADTTYAEEAAAILGHTLVTVQSGTYAQAALETPIYWAQDLASEDQSQRTALKLSEPLYGSRGEVALEAGTLLVAEVNVIAGSGLLQLHVTDVVVMKEGRQQVMSIPNQNLIITGHEGQPLVAREIQNTDAIWSAELQLAALGALGNVGQLLNRPDSQQSTIGIGGSFTSIENGPVNILAGLLEGVADAVLPIEQSRVEDRINDYENQPRIWFHDADAPVMLFVAEEFTFQAD